MGKYQLVSSYYAPLEQGKNVVHRGTGVDGLVSTAGNFIDPATVAQDWKQPLKFVFEPYQIIVLSLEIKDKVAPNWFGCAFRSDQLNFEAVNIFFHPVPKLVDFPPEEYWTRSTKWSSLFRYVEGLGSQLFRENSDQVLLIPFFNNASYSSTGIFAANWLDIANDALKIASSHPRSLAGPGKLGLKRIVLSDFSRGRELMHNFISRATPGVEAYLGEVWDIDGVGGGPPTSIFKAKSILYDQHRNNAPGSFHTPSNRWLDFNHVDKGDVHGNMPMLFRHAARISNI